MVIPLSGLSHLSALWMDSIIHLNVKNSNAMILGQNIVTQTSIRFNGIDSNLFNNNFQLKQRLANNAASQSKSESHQTFVYDYEVRQGEWLNYTIHFKNTTNATIQDILIIDTFPISIDPSTIEMTYSKHPYTLKQISNRIFHWDFAGIQLSNDTSNGSHESQFSFRIKPPKFYGKTIDITNRASIVHNYFQKPLPIESIGFIVETAENPTLFSQSLSLFEDSSINFCLHAKDVDSNTTLSFNIAKQGNYGAVNLVADSCFRYKPNVNYYGRDSFSMRVCDQTGLCDTKWFYVQVIPLNDTPNISSATYTSFIDSFVVFCPTISDPDSNGGLSTTICALAKNGSIQSINATCYRYTPNAGFFGKDSVCIKVCDPSGLCRQSIQNILTIKRPFKPIITDSLIYGKEDSSILICPKIFDEDISDEFVFTLCKNAMHGASVISNKCISYIPNKDYDDRDSICVEVCDKYNLCSSKTLHIINRGSPDPPTVSDTNLLIKNNMPFSFIPKVMDVDRNDVHTFSVYKKPSIGSVSFAGNTITYYPNKFFKGQEEMTILVQDQFGLNNTFLVKMQMLDASSIENIDAQNMYSIYPNPADEEIRLQFVSTDLGDKTWQIFNVYGSRVMDGKILGQIGSIQTPIHVGDLVPGIYFVHLLDAGNMKVVGKFEKR
ncbi:MAG: tandem-95 repeat protein [Bacteroidetes bacterium]|nr:tandem-95 repeat protein [Bacteroidota bacterium]